MPVPPSFSIELHVRIRFISLFAGRRCACGCAFRAVDIGFDAADTSLVKFARTLCTDLQGISLVGSMCSENSYTSSNYFNGWISN